jgi:hypothetical protein
VHPSCSLCPLWLIFLPQRTQRAQRFHKEKGYFQTVSGIMDLLPNPYKDHPVILRSKMFPLHRTNFQTSNSIVIESSKAIPCRSDPNIVRNGIRAAIVRLRYTTVVRRDSKGAYQNALLSRRRITPLLSRRATVCHHLAQAFPCHCLRILCG